MDLWVFLTFCLMLLLNVIVFVGIAFILRKQKRAGDALWAIISILQQRRGE